MKDLKLDDLCKDFGGHDASGQPALAVNYVSLEAEKGQLLTLLGPSGCGKTTLLRMIAGFEEPTHGDIWFGDRRVNAVPPNARDAAMVFQSYAIFPHLNVFENVAFGLRRRRCSAAEIKSRVDRALAICGLAGFERRGPDQLSGGQQQRVALARCIVLEPRLLLFDEPLSNLDAKLREQMRMEIRELQQRLGITTVYVTHDQAEAMCMSDLIAVMNAGVVQQVAAPAEIYGHPKNRFVAGFIGEANFAPAQVIDSNHVSLDGTAITVSAHGLPAGKKITLVLRPEALAIDTATGLFPARVNEITFLGSTAQYTLTMASPQLKSWTVTVINPTVTGLLASRTPVFVTPMPGSATVLNE